MKHNRKQEIPVEELLKRYKRRLRAVTITLAAFLLLTALYLYLNYDYLAFKHFMTSSYIYTDTLDKVFEKELGKDVKGGWYGNFDDMVISVVTSRIRQENSDKYTYLYTPDHLKKYKQDEKQEAQTSEIRILNDRTLYLRLSNFSTYTGKFVKENLEKLKSRQNIILDLQDDRGGDIDVMVDISSHFLPRKAVVAVDRFRWKNWTYRSTKNQPLKYDRILILQNGNTASASENMIAALNDNLENVTLIGSKTFGKGIGQFTLPLKRGYAVKATILEWFTPRGLNIQGNGIDPEIEYTGDDILQFALKQLDS